MTSRNCVSAIMAAGCLTLSGLAFCSRPSLEASMTPFQTSAVPEAVPQDSAAKNAARPSVYEVIDTRQEAIVKLFGAGVGNLDSYGTGTLISPEGHVLTVWNHLINVGFLTAVTNDGQRYNVTVVGTSREYDIALLKLSTDGSRTFPYVDLSRSADAEAGTPVMAFSNMFRVATGNEPVSVVHGVVAARAVLTAGLGRWEFPLKTPVLITDVVTNNSGACGGLLTRTDGTPIGLIGREIRHRVSQTWVNYSVPLTVLNPIVEQLKSGRPTESTPRNVKKSTSISDRQLTAGFGITMLPDIVERTPAYIDQIVRGSVADQSGLRRGDLILLVDDDIVTSVKDFQQLLSERRPGQKVSITVSRQQQLVAVELRIP